MAFDEKIIALINGKRQAMDAVARNDQITNFFRTGGDCLKVDGVSLKFEEKSIFDGQVILKLPTGLEILLPEKTRLKYPSDSKPDLILTTSDGLINITFKHSRIPLDEGIMDQLKDRIIMTINKKHSRVCWQKEGIKQVNGKQIGFCNFIVPTLDGNVFSLMFFVELNHQALIGNINGPVSLIEYWQPIADGLVESIKIATESDDIPLKPPVANFADYQFKSGLYASYHNKEYQTFKLADGNYRLISFDSRDLEDGFEKKDGVYKKTVSDGELQSLYELETKIMYRGNIFELGEVCKNEVQLIKKKCHFELARQLQLEKDSWSGKYGKRIAKTEIEDVIEEKRSIK